MLKMLDRAGKPPAASYRFSEGRLALETYPLVSNAGGAEAHLKLPIRHGSGRYTGYGVTDTNQLEWP